MQSFFERFPRVGEAILATLLVIIGFFAQQTIDNNTKAMESLSATLDKMAAKVSKHDVKLAEHELRIRICEGDK